MMYISFHLYKPLINTLLSHLELLTLTFIQSSRKISLVTLETEYLLKLLTCPQRRRQYAGGKIW
jgi:hypothetical protein